MQIKKWRRHSACVLKDASCDRLSLSAIQTRYNTRLTPVSGPSWKPTTCIITVLDNGLISLTSQTSFRTFSIVPTNKTHNVSEEASRVYLRKEEASSETLRILLVGTLEKVLKEVREVSDINHIVKTVALS
jgi:hypothetical protein